ncbi:MAG TPA: hypothetical protein VIY28_01570 [Pseudonocardiaceae bacterium]
MIGSASIPVRRRLLLAVLVAVVFSGSALAWSVGGALLAPGTDSVAARLAEWGRDHGFDGLITWLELQQYERNQPPTGGVPAGGIPLAAGTLPAPARPPEMTGPPVLPEPPPLPPPPGIAPLPGEGQWETVAIVHGRPAVRVAHVRPDREHTSFLVGVMWMDPTLVRGQLHPGFQDPGGSWQAGTSLTLPEQHTVVAVFNGGFRLNGASHGGYYSQGRTARPLLDGAASLVLHEDGTATVGAWNRDVRMDRDVASVRQNLVPLVDDGRVSPTCQSGGTAQWGSTIGQAAYIHRSAFGVTATGGEVYVGGPALSVCSLGRILQASSVVRGMELDINPSWVSGAYFHPAPQGPTQSFRLFPGEQVAAEHYFSPSSRDWFAFYARP